MTEEVGMDKPGIKTTEFWVGTVIVPVLVPIIMALVNKYGFPLTESAVTAIVISAVTAPVTYILGRIFHKKKITDVVKASVEAKRNA